MLHQLVTKKRALEPRFHPDVVATNVFENGFPANRQLTPSSGGGRFSGSLIDAVIFMINTTGVLRSVLPASFQ